MKTIYNLVLVLFLICNIAVAQDTMYIYKSGSVSIKQAIVDIDSVVFYKANITPIDTIISDIDGNVYNIVNIGSQIWMKENLRVTKYRNGDIIGTTNPSTLDIRNEVNPKYQWAYDGNENNATTYGRLYTWGVIIDSRNICPSGWHASTDNDWTKLTTYLGGETTAGSKIKESDTLYWQSPNNNANNSSGLTARGSGMRMNGGALSIFSGLRNSSYWWSPAGNNDYTERWIVNGFSQLQRASWSKDLGFSVRCLKNLTETTKR